MIKLLGIPYDANSSFMRGAAGAPRRIRLAAGNGSANAGAEMGAEIREGVNFQDAGNLHVGNVSPEQAHKAIRARVAEQLADGSKLLTLGGDHSITYPIIEAYAEAHPGLHVLQFDAHTDLYDNFDGNPYSHASPFARIMEKGLVKSLTQVGIRCLTNHQREQAERFDVKIVEMKDWPYRFLETLEGPLYLSFDMDGLDPAFAPGVSHHEPGGPSTREAIQVIQGIGVPLVGADIVEYNPVRDLNGVTAMVAYKLLKEIIAKML